MARYSHSAVYTPLVIVLVGALIAGVVFFFKGGNTAAGGGSNGARTMSGFRMPDESDHVRGDPRAPITIVEFSDFECPFCARLHPTLEQIVKENKDTKWVYRHFPLTSIHSRAFDAAVAAECVATLGGNDAFWFFADAAFANQGHLGSALYGSLATQAGIEKGVFNACLSDKAAASAVEEDSNEAVSAGGRGTPFAVVVTAKGQLISFSGALPYENINRLLDQARVN